MRVMSELRSLHAEGNNPNKGINGSTGQITDMAELGIYEAFLSRCRQLRRHRVCHYAAPHRRHLLQ